MLTPNHPHTHIHTRTHTKKIHNGRAGFKLHSSFSRAAKPVESLIFRHTHSYTYIHLVLYINRYTHR